jgi:hypothetical protein
MSDAVYSEKHRWAVLLGRRGGKAAAARRTPEERQALARKAAQARWARCRHCRLPREAHCEFDAPGVDHPGWCDKVHHEFRP